MTGRTDIATRLIGAPAEAIYRAFVDPSALMVWLPPEGMSGRALLFEPREGGRYRIELAFEGKGSLASSLENLDRFVAMTQPQS